MNNNKYLELLQQYRSGTISEADRHVLERAALDDPFLFDAMEGYGVHGSSNDAQIIKELSKDKKSDDGKVRWLNTRIMGVAASLIALVAITFLVKNQLSTDVAKENVTVANNDAPQAPEPMAQIFENNSTATDDQLMLESKEVEKTTEGVKEEIEFVATKVGDMNATASKTEKTLPPPTSNSPSTIITKDVDTESDMDIDLANEIIKTKASPIEILEEEEVIVFEDLETESAQVKANPTGESEMNARSKSKKSKPEEDAITYADTDGKGNNILGKVLDAEGNQLIGATVYIENTEIGSVTDIEGNFKLPKYESGHQIVITYTGYKTQKIILGDIDFYQIVLQEQEVLSEVKVTRLKEVGQSKAYPSMGIEEFEIYVRDNMKFPLEVFGTTKSGRIKVSFDVDMSGNLSNFINESKNCDECFIEAVRLLNGSGRWETKPFGTAYRTSFQFEF